MVSPFVEIQVGDRVVKVTNPGRVYFPERGETKRDLVGYYLAVGDGIMRVLGDRPTTPERWPGGVVEGARLSARADDRGNAFFQKRVPKKSDLGGGRPVQAALRAVSPSLRRRHGSRLRRSLCGPAARHVRRPARRRPQQARLRRSGL